jgi:hypothetical protein
MMLVLTVTMFFIALVLLVGAEIVIRRIEREEKK